MRLTIAQIDMYMLAGEWLEFCEPDELPLTERLASARESLAESTKQDFGYDLCRWHYYLVEHHKDEYCWGDVHRDIFARIKQAEANPAWQAAVTALGR